jgi:tRNA modification GTPase
LDTIVSPASAPVSQAVGIVRVSGPKAFELSARLIRAELPKPGTFAFRDVVNPATGQIIDSGLVLVFKTPSSFTGEDVVEFQLHGSPAILEEVTALIVSFGARRAEAGEFSFRALANGKASLPELELANALSGLKTQGGNAGIADKLKNWRDRLTRILATIEAGISFPNDSQTDMTGIRNELVTIKDDVSSVIVAGKPGMPKITLAGKQNAGKSTLFNRLLGFHRMVVSDVAGTTRDHLSEEIEINERCCLLFDGPGFEEESDDSGQTLYSGFVEVADVVVWVDPDGNPPEKTLKNAILVKSKSDVYKSRIDGWIEICAKTGDGLENLIDAISKALPSHDYAITQRQYDILKKLEEVLGQSVEDKPEELIASDLSYAVSILSELDGVGLSGDVLGTIFSSFCIGK